jgi:sulfhydrogenase subunit beta (sulfur reductase)
MGNIYKINRDEWYRLLLTLSVSSYNIFAPVRKTGGIDYTIINKENGDLIIYNEAKPATPLKMFFLPVKLNVTRTSKDSKKIIILGVPACDIEGLKLLDLIYLDGKYSDDSYLSRRENTLLISTDCYVTQEHCHCTTYGINPYPSNGCDISLSSDKDDHYLMTWSEKGERFIKELDPSVKIDLTDNNRIEAISNQREQTIRNLSEKNERMPGTKETGIKVKRADEDIWKKYSSKCVSCGACSAICPTCTCFLLIDKTGFEKVKQIDTCQYPAFERVAGGEDPLKDLHVRFKNRYMCKYVWKPEKFEAIACTGCGRCIEACIAKINKNELIQEFTENSN